MASKKPKFGIPDRIWYGYRSYKVIIEADPHQMGGLLGRYHGCEGKIYVSGNQDPVEMLNTIIHEGIHAMFRESGYDDVIRRNELQEEDVARMVANGMVELFIRNPALLELLCDVEKEENSELHE